MNEANGIEENVDKIADDTRALLAATAYVAEEKVVQARNRLKATLSAAKDACAVVQKRAVEGAQEEDKFIRDKPYHAMGLAFGVGALVGFLLCRRK